MTGGGCERAWMAEALDDGRLGEGDRAAFRRHLAGCSACVRATDDVNRMRERMNALPHPPTSDLHHQAQRRQLLVRAGRAWPKAHGHRGPTRWRRLAVGCALIACGAAAVVVRLHRERPAELASEPEAPRYEVTGLADASWTNMEAGSVAKVVLERGSAAFHVHHLRAGQRFLVILPDGEIEVRGTRFVVLVEGARTRYVVVMEGKVALHRPGAEERLFNAGERWDAPATSPETPSPPAPAAVIPSPPHELAPRLRRVATAKETLRPGTIETPRRAPGDPADLGQRGSTREASNLFAKAISAFRAGRFEQAEPLWRAFLERFPTDPRAEDAAFLRAIGRARAGDAAGAAAFAREYLEHFPEGMRRREAEALSRRP